MNRSVRVFIGLETSPATGEWVDVDPDPETTQDAIGEAQRRLGADRESGVMDTDDWPRSTSGLHVIQLCVSVAEMSGVDVDAVLAYVENHDASGAYWDDEYDLQAEFDEAWQGVHESESDFAYELADELGTFNALSDSLRAYIAWDLFARDLFLGDYWSASCPTGGIYVFRSA